MPWLRSALQANGADLVITPAGYRVYSLQRASTGTGALPSLAPPQQAESIFVQGYAAERAGRDREAAQLYAQLVNAYPTTGIAAMARERRATLQRRANAPSRATTLPSEVSMAGAYLCTRRGLYPNESKWCGFVRGEIEDQLRVEVREISYNGLFIEASSPATANALLQERERSRIEDAKDAIRSALTYPLILLFVAFMSVMASSSAPCRSDGWLRYRAFVCRLAGNPLGLPRIFGYSCGARSIIRDITYGETDRTFTASSI